jgi:hypothetical protein
MCSSPRDGALAICTAVDGFGVELCVVSSSCGQDGDDEGNGGVPVFSEDALFEAWASINDHLQCGSPDGRGRRTNGGIDVRSVRSCRQN